MDGLRIAFLRLQAESLLADVITAKDSLNFLKRIGDESLEIPHLGKGVADQVFHRFTHRRHGSGGLGFERLAASVIFSTGHEFTHRGV